MKINNNLDNHVILVGKIKKFHLKFILGYDHLDMVREAKRLRGFGVQNILFFLTEKLESVKIILLK